MSETPKKRIRKWDQSPQKKEYNKRYHEEWKSMKVLIKIDNQIREVSANFGIPKNHLATSILEEWLELHPDKESQASWVTARKPMY